jgi:hypothetical protein
MADVAGTIPFNATAAACFIDAKGTPHVVGGHAGNGQTTSNHTTAACTGLDGQSPSCAWSPTSVPKLVSEATARSDAFISRGGANSTEVLVLGGYHRSGTGKGLQRTGLVDPVWWDPAKDTVRAAARPAPAARIGHAHGWSDGRGLCIAAGLHYDLAPDTVGPARVTPLTDAWCAKDGKWSLVSKTIAPFAFGFSAIDHVTDKMVLAGGYLLSKQTPVAKVWRLWEAGPNKHLTFGKSAAPSMKPNVSDAMYVIDLKTNSGEAAKIKGPKLAAGTSAYDRMRRRLIGYGGFDDKSATATLITMNLDTLQWKDLGAPANDPKDQPSAMIPRYGAMLAYSPEQQLLAVAGGVQWKVHADKSDLVQKRISPTTPAANACIGEIKSPMWLVNVAQPDKSVFAAVPAYQDLDSEHPQRLLRLDFGQPAFLPFLFDPIGGRALALLPDVKRTQATDANGKTCPGPAKTNWTAASIQVQLSFGVCPFDNPVDLPYTVFVEPSKLDPVPDAMFMASAVRAPNATEWWVWGGLRADATPSSSLWRLQQACKSKTP